MSSLWLAVGGAVAGSAYLYGAGKRLQIGIVESSGNDVYGDLSYGGGTDGKFEPYDFEPAVSLLGNVTGEYWSAFVTGAALVGLAWVVTEMVRKYRKEDETMREWRQ